MHRVSSLTSTAYVMPAHYVYMADFFSQSWNMIRCQNPWTLSELCSYTCKLIDLFRRKQLQFANAMAVFILYKVFSSVVITSFAAWGNISFNCVCVHACTCAHVCERVWVTEVGCDTPQVCHCRWLSFTRPSPTLVLQETNAGVRGPGYEARYTLQRGRAATVCTLAWVASKLSGNSWSSWEVIPWSSATSSIFLTVV